MNKRQSLYVMLLTVAVLAVFGNTLLNGFVWDDLKFLVGNRVYKDFALGNIFFSLANGVEYLPLRDLTYAVDYAVWGENAAGFHFTNLLLYLANVLVVYCLARRLFALVSREEESREGHKESCAMLTALLFAVHPIHSETVSFITCRNVLLSSLFFFSACLIFLRFLHGEEGRRSGYYLGALLCFVCALLSKATVITLPLVLILFVAFDSRKIKVKDVAFLAPFFLVSIFFYFLFKAVAIQTMIIDDRLSFTGSTLAAKIATALEIPFFYLNKLVLPVKLSGEYDVKFGTTLADPLVIGAFLALVALAVLAVAVRKKNPVMMFSLGWFLAALIPVLNFFSTNPVVADRYAYLSSFGFVFFAAVSLTRSGKRTRNVSLYAAILLVLCWSAASFARNMVWKNDKSLWQETVRTSPNNGSAYLNLADIYFHEGEHAKAFSLLAKLDKLHPVYDYSELYHGLLYYKKGDLPAAISSYKKVLAKCDDFIAALYLLGKAYVKVGAYEQAIDSFNKAIESRGQDFKDYRAAAIKDRQNLLITFVPQLSAMRKRTAENPQDFRARGELALRLDVLGLYNEALDNYRELEKYAPDNWQISYNMANVYKKMRRYREAAGYYEKSLVLNPTYVDSLNNLATVYRDMKDFDRAVEIYKKIIAGNDRFALAPFNLASTYLQMGDKQNAIRYFKYTQERFPELKVKTARYLKELQER